MIEQALPTLDLRCVTCGYGVARLQPPERCPMCAGSRWERHPRWHAAIGHRLENAAGRATGAETSSLQRT